MIKLIYAILLIPIGLPCQNVKFLNELRCSHSIDVQLMLLTNHYKEALKCVDENDIEIINTLKLDDNVVFYSADSFIYDKAKTNKILCFNELHHYPGSRIFLFSILDSLVKLGYKDIALEDISHNNTINSSTKIGYKDGFYIEELFYSILVRKCQMLKITVHPYEASKQYWYSKRDEKGVLIEEKDTINNFFNKYEYDENGNLVNIITNAVFHREREQAENLAKIYPKIKDKLIIFAGVGHIYEGNSRSMISLLKSQTGLDPITFDLTCLTEKSKTTFEDTIYRNLKLNRPSIININGKNYNGFNLTDYSIAMPRYVGDCHIDTTLYSLGRYDYVLNEKHYIDKLKYPIICSAFRFGDNEDSIPFYTLEIINDKSSKTLLLPYGNYNFVLKDYYGSRVNFKDSVLNGKPSKNGK